MKLSRLEADVRVVLQGRLTRIVSVLPKVSLHFHIVLEVCSNVLDLVKSICM